MKKTKIVRTWFPTSKELFCDVDSEELKFTVSDYLYSLWVGFATPIITMPELMWRFIVAPLLDGAATIVFFVVASWVSALRGKALGARVVAFDDSKTDRGCNG